MRRSDRAICSEEEILQVLDRCDTIRLGFSGGAYPYIVPLSFGWEQVRGRVYLYVHGAREGLRHQLREKDFRVCVEADRMLGYARIEDGMTCRYESVIGFGRAECVTGEDAIHGLQCIMAHCGFGNEGIPRETAEHTSVWKITLSQLTGKRHDV